MSRKIEELSPEMLPICIQWRNKMDDAQIEHIITCTRRTQAEQEALWAVGRTTPGKIITWTLTSKHLTGDAFDFVVLWNGKPDWNMVQKQWWQTAVAIGKGLGLQQAVNKEGKVLEYAHLQRG